MALGRPPEAGEPRTEILRVRFTPAEIAAIDAARGPSTRSDYVRNVLQAVSSPIGSRS